MVRLALPAILTAAGRVRFFRETRQQLNGGRAARLAKLDCSIGKKLLVLQAAGGSYKLRISCKEAGMGLMVEQLMRLRL